MKKNFVSSAAARVMALAAAALALALAFSGCDPAGLFGLSSSVDFAPLDFLSEAEFFVHELYPSGAATWDGDTVTLTGTASIDAAHLGYFMNINLVISTGAKLTVTNGNLCWWGGTIIIKDSGNLDISGTGRLTLQGTRLVLEQDGTVTLAGGSNISISKYSGIYGFIPPGSYGDPSHLGQTKVIAPSGKYLWLIDSSYHLSVSGTPKTGGNFIMGKTEYKIDISGDVTSFDATTGAASGWLNTCGSDTVTIIGL
jgi:hypothetical protein